LVRGKRVFVADIPGRYMSRELGTDSVGSPPRWGVPATNYGGEIMAYVTVRDNVPITAKQDESFVLSVGVGSRLLSTLMNERVVAALLILFMTFVLLLALSRTVLGATSDSRVANLLQETSVSEVDRTAGAVTLLKESSIELDEDGRERVRDYVAVQVFDNQAIADYGVIKIAYNSHNEEVTLDFARVLYSDGRIKAVAGDAVQVKTPADARMYTDLKFLTFALPTLERGATLEYQVTSAPRAQVIPGHWFSVFLLNRAQESPLTGQHRIDPALRARLTVSVPERRELVYTTENIELSPQVVTRGERRTYTWEAAGVPGIPVEPQTGEILDRVPRVVLSTIAHWKTLHDWAVRVFVPSSQPTPALEVLARQVTKDATTRSEKIEALFYFVQEKLRYIATDLYRGGVKPHTAEEVWANRYGDCKDQTMLLVALLRAADVDAYPALVNILGEGTLSIDVPMLHFTHMVTYVPNGASGLWIDSSGDATAFPGLDWTSKDRWAFIIDDDGGVLVKTPGSEPEDNQVRVDVDFEFSGRNIVGHMSLETSGAASDRLKAALSLNPDRDKFVRTIVKSVSPKARILGLDFPGLGDPRAPFAATARFELSVAWQLGQDFAQSIGMVPMLSFTRLLELPEPRLRKTDYFIGLPMQLTQAFHYPAPSDAYEANILSPVRFVETPHMSHYKSVDRTGSGVTVGHRIVLKQTTVPRDEYEDFHASVQDMLEASEAIFVFKERKTPRVPKASAASVGSTGNEGPAARLRRARMFLKKGRYVEARTLVEEILPAAPQNGEAHYLLGVALGQLDEYGPSAAAFKKASEFGYTP